MNLKSFCIYTMFGIVLKVLHAGLDLPGQHVIMC